ncbi:MAG: hypothetical protein LUE21_08505, partial [Oscillospiraceae bacterium]|nr:hypothetical protein [Oscillospiraceae bacterium]
KLQRLWESADHPAFGRSRHLITSFFPVNGRDNIVLSSYIHMFESVHIIPLFMAYIKSHY